MSVPATVGETKRRLEEVAEEPEKLLPLTEGYRYTAFSTTYAAGVEQRWLVIYSQAARAAKAVDKRLLKQGDEECKAFDELRQRRFTARKMPGGRWRRSEGR